MTWIRCEKCGRRMKPLVTFQVEHGGYLFTAQCTTEGCGNTSLPCMTGAEAMNQLGEAEIGGEDDLGRFIPSGSARRH